MVGAAQVLSENFQPFITLYTLSDAKYLYIIITMFMYILIVYEPNFIKKAQKSRVKCKAWIKMESDRSMEHEATQVASWHGGYIYIYISLQRRH